MDIIINNYYEGKLLINIEKLLINLLKTVPKNYLIGIKSIVLVNKISDRNYRDAAGLYMPQQSGELPWIKIGIDQAYLGHTKLLVLIPFLRKLFLAKVLYHEIGHHLQYKKRIPKKQNHEKYAEQVANDLLEKLFIRWKILLYPVYLIALIIKKTDKKNTNPYKK